MKRFTEWVRALLLAPEMIPPCLMLLAAIRYPDLALRIARLLQIRQLDTASASLIVAPIGLVVVAYKLAENVLRPSVGREILVQWPDYWRLRARVLIGIGYTVVGYAGWLVGLLAIQASKDKLGVIIATSSLGSALVAVLTLGLAQLIVRDIVEGADSVPI